jgi:hypothetical protein
MAKGEAMPQMAQHQQWRGSLFAHTNNISEYSFLIVGARRMAKGEATPQMAQHQQWRGLTQTLKCCHSRRCCVLRKEEICTIGLFFAHTNNISDCCLLIVGARRMAKGEAMPQMAQHQQWRG